MDAAVQYYCTEGIAQSTQKTYQSALRKFTEFSSTYSLLTPFPVSEAILCYFATYVGMQGLSPSTIKCYLAGIRHTQITLGFPEPRQFSSLPRLRLVQAGIQRSYSRNPNSSIKIRLTITPAILLRLKQHWSSSASNPDTTMLWAAAVMCFFGFFRAGEITTPSLTSFENSRHLSWGDVSINDHSPSTIVKVHLKYSKTNQWEKGVDIFLGATGCSLCPVAGVVEYMSVRGGSPGPFFKLENERPLTKSYFSQQIRAALQSIGLPYQNFAGHSFRIGAATAAARAGIEDSKIQAMGRWISGVFLTYIRTPREELAQFSTTLVSATQQETAHPIR